MLTQYKFFIFSSDPDKLVKFYTDVLGCRIIKKLEYDLDYGYTIEISEGGMQIWLAKHSEVEGKNKDPFRHIMNIYTDSIAQYLEKAREYQGVKIVAEPFSMGDIIPGETRWACTILDPEDNCIQLMGKI
ncbi:MAG: VOC family protein [Candidatus Saccharibacteria bacterium]|nr:VOC family protein [Candidatus Saccharibacteria bacterium]